MKDNRAAAGRSPDHELGAKKKMTRSLTSRGREQVSRLASDSRRHPLVRTRAHDFDAPVCWRLRARLAWRSRTGPGFFKTNKRVAPVQACAGAQSWPETARALCGATCGAGQGYTSKSRCAGRACEISLHAAPFAALPSSRRRRVTPRLAFVCVCRQNGCAEQGRHQGGGFMRHHYRHGRPAGAEWARVVGKQMLEAVIC